MQNDFIALFYFAQNMIMYFIFLDRFSNLYYDNHVQLRAENL